MNRILLKISYVDKNEMLSKSPYSLKGIKLADFIATAVMIRKAV